MRRDFYSGNIRAFRCRLNCPLLVIWSDPVRYSTGAGPQQRSFHHMSVIQPVLLEDKRWGRPGPGIVIGPVCLCVRRCVRPEQN